MKKMLLLTSLVVMILWPMFDYSFARFGLIIHGHPFAHIVPKQQLGIHIFDYVDTDLMQAEALVFSHERPVGWIYHGMAGEVQYVPFDGSRQFTPSDLRWEMVRISWFLFAVLLLFITIIYSSAGMIAQRFGRCLSTTNTPDHAL